MTVWMAIGLVILILLGIASRGMNKEHRSQTGVDMPTPSAMKNIRRQARNKGISVDQAYSQWLQRKQRGIRRPFQTDV